MQAARGAPGIDSCSMGEWALGRGLVVVCPPMAGSCINFLKPLTQTGNPTTGALINKPTKKLAPEYPEKGWPWNENGVKYFWQIGLQIF